MYSERFENRATVKAGELVKAGAIGRVVQTIGLGPHRINPPDAARVVLGDSRATAASSATSARTRPDQFLYFTGSTRGRRRRRPGRRTCIIRNIPRSRISAT